MERMKLDEVGGILKSRLPEFRQRCAVRPLAFFGSVARDRTVPASDVDLIVELDLIIIGEAETKSASGTNLRSWPAQNFENGIYRELALSREGMTSGLHVRE